MKKVISGLLCFVMLLCAGCSSSEPQTTPNADGDALSQTEIDEKLDQAIADLDKALADVQGGQTAPAESEPKEETTLPDIDEADYLIVTAKQMFDDMNANPIKAEVTYLDKYVAVTGYYESTLLSDKDFSMTDDISSDNSIFCYTAGNISKKDFVGIQRNTKVTVWGKVTSINSDDDRYLLDAYKFEFEAEVDPDEADYIEVTVDEMVKAYESDSYNAQELYLGKYVTFPAYIDDIHSDRIELDDDAPDNGMGGVIATTDGYVQGAYPTDEIRLAIAEHSSGDAVTVWGKVTNIYQTYGITVYYVDIFRIE